MADFANAVVKFRVKDNFKEAFQIVFNRMFDKSLDLDYFDYGFTYITVDGVYCDNYDEDNEYLDISEVRVGCNFNLESDFSISFEQGIVGDEVTLCFSKKWGTVDRLKYIIEDFLNCVAEEVYFCEIIGLLKISFEDNEIGEYYHRISYNVFHSKNENWFNFEEKERIKIDYED